MLRRLKSYWVGVFAALVLLVGCGRSFDPNPTDKYVKKYMNNRTFSVVLTDMDVEGVFFKVYQHKYKIIFEEEDSSIKHEETDWIEVSESYFWKNENNLGMELVSKGSDGVINKTAGPAGFNSYVGNEKYGRWERNSSGGSFWAFYGQYMFMSHLFGYGHHPIYYNHYNSYYSSYRNRKPYYGGSGSSRIYGTSGTHMRKTRPNFFKRQATRSGWSRSSSRTGRSGSSWGGGRRSGFGK